MATLGRGRWLGEARTIRRYRLTSLGINRGDAVEVLGTRLPKASDFSTTIPEPMDGALYEGNGYFCLNRSGTVTGYVD